MCETLRHHALSNIEWAPEYQLTTGWDKRNEIMFQLFNNYSPGTHRITWFKGMWAFDKWQVKITNNLNWFGLVQLISQSELIPNQKLFPSTFTDVVADKYATICALTTFLAHFVFVMICSTLDLTCCSYVWQKLQKVLLSLNSTLKLKCLMYVCISAWYVAL